MFNKSIGKNICVRLLSFALVLMLLAPALMLTVGANNTDLPEIPIGSQGSEINPGDGSVPEQNPNTPPTEDGGSGSVGLVVVIVIIAVAVLGLICLIGYVFFSKKRRGE